MKAVFVFSIAIAVMMSAGIGSLMIFGLVPTAQGMELILKSVAALGLLGLSTAVLAGLSNFLGGEEPRGEDTGMSCNF